MSSKKVEFVLVFNEISVKSCKCYVDYWKSLRQLKGSNSVQHDDSIEKVKTFRKYFYEDKTLLHFCVDCFQKVIVTIPLSAIVSEMRFRLRGGCIGYFLIGEKNYDEICDSCVMFVVERFTYDFITV